MLQREASALCVKKKLFTNSYEDYNLQYEALKLAAVTAIDPNKRSSIIHTQSYNAWQVGTQE